MVCGAYSSIFLDRDTVEGKGKKTSRFCVIEKEYSCTNWEAFLSNQLASQKLSFGQHQAPSLYKFNSLIQDLGCG